MQIVFYISGHGFGHASRDVELINTLGRLRPDLRFVIRSAVAPWLLQSTLRVAADIEALETDPGVVQIDSLRLDEAETARRAAAFYADLDRRADEEAGLLAARGAALVLGDIPPLAFLAAARAGVPSAAVANFTWDWIYAYYEAFDGAARRLLRQMGDAYAAATLALRLPLHGGFETMMPVVRDIPFIARRSTRDPAETRERLGAKSDRPLVLVSFGAYGVALDVERIAEANGIQIVAPDREAPSGLRYEDLVAAADVVVTKPGYGIVSECAANQTALLYTSRGHFAEYEVFVDEMPRFLKCRHFTQNALRQGRWRRDIDALLAQPAPPEPARVDGADVAANQIVEMIRRT